MRNKTPPSFTAFLAIKHWPTWLGIGILCFIAYLPFIVRLKIGALLGHLTYLLAKQRRYITHLNLTLCFPELGAEEHTALTRKCFRENGIGLIETTTGWVRGPAAFPAASSFIGKEHLDRALAKGKGVLLLGAHYSTLDVSGSLLSQHYNLGTTYRAHKNPLFDTFMLRGRLKSGQSVYDRNNIRGAFKHLRKGLVLWYAPDQDYGAEHAIYAPFFGNPAATINTASRFAAFNDSPTFLLRCHRIGNTSQYDFEFIPFPEKYPSDDHDDAVLLNKMLEASIRQCPEQYLWMHKRFKTQAEGKPMSPYIDIKTSTRKISSQHYLELISGAKILQENSPRQSLLQLNSDLLLQQFPTSIGKHTGLKHPAKKFDYFSKQLKLKGISSITCDVIFRVPEQELTAITYFPLPGKPLSSLIKMQPSDQLPLYALASLFSKLHQHGFQFSEIRIEKLLLNKQDFIVQNPEDIYITSPVLSVTERCENLRMLFAALAIEQAEEKVLINHYIEISAINAKQDAKDLLSCLSG